jgi:hypothetical protein
MSTVFCKVSYGQPLSQVIKHHCLHKRLNLIGDPIEFRNAPSIIFPLDLQGFSSIEKLNQKVF